MAEAARDFPEWMWELNGAGEPGAIWIDHKESRKRRGPRPDAGFRSGTWVMRLTLPSDLNEVSSDIDPLLVAMGLADSQERMETKLREAVRLCRARGRTWSQIGDALGTSKQAAWRRFGSLVETND